MIIDINKGYAIGGIFSVAYMQLNRSTKVTVTHGFRYLKGFF